MKKSMYETVVEFKAFRLISKCIGKFKEISV